MGAVLLAVTCAAALWFRDTSTTGHFASGVAKDEFVAAYDEAMRDLPDPDVVLDVRTSYGIVRVYRFDGPDTRIDPLVLLPGRASASPVWADNLPTLLEVRDVYTVDLLGEPGASVQDRPIENDEDQARWLHETLMALPEPKVHVLGLSIGGWTTANLAMRAPEKIASVTLVEPVFTFGNIPLQTVVRSVPASVGWLPKSWRDSFNSYTAGGASVEDVPVANMIELGMANYSLHLPTPSRIPESDLAALRMPVLAVIAGKSVMHDASGAVELAERALPNGSVKLYPDASHAINGEYPDELAADIAAFLKNAS